MQGRAGKLEEIGGEEGAAQQLEQILASGLPPLYRTTYRILGNTADAEDAVQDALLAAYTHLNQFKGQAKISTWLTTHSVPFVELRQPLTSTVRAIFPFTEQLMRFILAFRSADGSESDIEMALHEALANAVVRGTGENYCKRVYVSCRCYMDGELSITVRDQGKGFDSSALIDPSSSENLLCTHGRGIYLMKALMDEVCFEEDGAVVMMRKKSNASSPEGRKAR
jgi:serine/threonine-protein kinase RsbW